MSAPAPVGASGRALDRQLLALAVPSLGALVAEPLFVLVDSAIVGTLGTGPLAGLGAAGAVLQTAVGLFVVLAYATTAAVARAAGSGDVRTGLSRGVDGVWSGLVVGAVVAGAGEVCAPELLRALGTPAGALAPAVAYLRASLPGLPGMLVVLAATGALRGLRDARTPLLVAAGGAALNAVAVAVAVLGLGLGTAGSGAATAATQTLMAVALIVRLRPATARLGVRWRPRRAGLALSARASLPLLVRTVTLRAALLLTTAGAAAQGSSALAAHQVAMTVWSLLALALDALAIAAQAITGAALGAGDAAGARAATARALRWGVGTGVVLGVGLAALSGVLPLLFSHSPAVVGAARTALLVAAVGQPLAGWVFVLDGVLIGAGDGRYLAVAGAVVLAVYAPLAVTLRAVPAGGSAGLVLLWCAFAGVFMGARAVVLGVRARSDAWLVTGAVR